MKLQQERSSGFNPLTFCKADSLDTSLGNRLDFFIASALKTFNDCLYMSKRSMFGQRQHPLKSSYLIQRFVPTQHEGSTFVYRCSWKKDVGYKVHKITSLVTETTSENAEDQVQAKHNYLKPKSGANGGHFKLLNFHALTDAYKTIQTYSTEKLRHHLSLHLSSPSGILQHGQESPQRGGVKLDLTSLKNQQHLLL